MTGHLEILPIENLREYHRNPRKGNVPAIAASLEKHGQFRPLVVNTGAQTGREWEVLAGNHTLRAMRHLNTQAQEKDEFPPHPEVACWIVDVDETQAAQIVAVDNKTSDDSGYNDEALADLLQSLPTLDGTGYQDHELQALLDSLEADEQEEPEEEITNPYDDFIPLRLNLAPPLMQQWLAHATQFDSGEEALEYLLDHSEG